MNAVLVRPERCIGCHQCTLACAVEHSSSRDLFAAGSERPPPHGRVHVEAGERYHESLPVLCAHCDPAPCEAACPTGAISRDESLELVLLDASKCIGCAMCAMVCPFDVIELHPVKADGSVRSRAVKCDGCVRRVRRGEAPACVEVCKVDALVFGEPNELAGEKRRKKVAETLAAGDRRAGDAEETVAPWREWGSAAAGLRTEEDGGER